MICWVVSPICRPRRWHSKTKNQLLKVGDKFNNYSIGEIFWCSGIAQAEETY